MRKSQSILLWFVALAVCPLAATPLAATPLAATPVAAADSRGRVTFGGVPVPGATVTATQGEKRAGAITDDQGVYTLDLSAGAWKIRVEMLCFQAQEREVSMVDGGPAPDWELKLLPVDMPRATVQAGRTDFQRAGLNASDGPVKEEPPAEVDQAPSDGFLINGSVNNGASTPFAQAAAFGNYRLKRPQYNGSLGLTFDGSFWDARAFSLTGQDTLKPSYTRSRGFAAFGGPVRFPGFSPRNAPDLTVNYQWTRESNATMSTGRVPTAAERSGDLSQSTGAVIDPLSGAPFPGRVIPASRISPQARALLALYPAPNFDSAARYNFQVPLVGATHQDNLQSRINKSAGRKDAVFGRFDFESVRGDSTNSFGFLDTTGTSGINASASWFHRFAPRSFLTLGYQYSRLASRVTPYFAGRQNVSAAAGISGNNQDAANWGPPVLSFSSGINSLSDAQSSFTRNQTSAASGSFFWNWRAHNLTMGADFRRQQFNLLAQQDPRGAFTFTGAAGGSDLAGFLLGIPDASSIAFGNADKYLRASGYDGYFADDWRAAPSLTVNAGLRWDYSTPVSERHGRLANLNVGPGFETAAPVVAANLEPYRRAFQPRVGLAWRPLLASSLVVRAGYGVYYDSSVYLPVATRMSQQPPLSKTLSVDNSASTPLTLADGFSAAAAMGTFAVDPHFRPGYSQNWQLSIQRDLLASMVVTAAYLGIKGTRMQQEFLPNTFPAGLDPCPACPAGYLYLASNGNSTRESGQIQLRRRLRSGVAAQLSYTFSKSIDDGAAGPAGQGSVIAQDWRNLSGERGLSNFDQRHLLNLQAQYTTGMGLAGGTLLGGWRGGLFKDWTFAAQVTAGSGLPLTPVYPSAVRRTGVTGTVRSDYTGASLYDAPPGLFLNPAAVAAPAAGRWGNAGRNSITGPGQFVLNASLARTFRPSDRVSADFRLDSTNALNHPTFAGWNTVATSPQFGLATAANPMRSLQATMRVRF